MSISCEPVPAEVVSMSVATGNLLTSAGCESVSRMSAPSPRPSAFLAISDDLLCKLYVSLGTFTMYVVEQNGLPVTRRFSQPYISGNDALENLGAEKAPQVSSDLTRERRPFVIHCENDALDSQSGVERPADSHQRVQKLGNA